MENARPTRILMIDDDPAAADLVRGFLDRVSTGAFSLELAANAAEGEAMLAEGRHDLALVDLVLPDRDGVSLIRALRARGDARPLILLTGRGSRVADLEAMDAGASDYLPKSSLTPDSLERAIRYASLRERQRAAERELDRMRRFELVGRLAAGLAHELNNPLAVLLAGAAYMVDEIDALREQVHDRRLIELSEPARDAVEAATRMAEVVRRLSAFVGSARPTEAAVSVSEVALGAVERLRASAGRRDGTPIELMVPPELVVRGVHLHLEQALVELVTNAIEAEGATRVAITARAADGEIVLSVEDDGLGIEDAVRARAFEPFYSTKATLYGAGMGLTIAEEIAARHGGRVTLRRGAKKGTVAELHLPAA